MKKVYALVVDMRQIVLTAAAAAVFLALIYFVTGFAGEKPLPVLKNGEEYVILAANNLGMHCIQQNYSSFLILPPANNLKVQVFKKGYQKATLLQSGITVTYEIINNTSSADKINFWKYAKEYGYSVAPNIGITGNGLKGVCQLSNDGKYFEAAAIPVVPFNDGSTRMNPYQLARITVTDNRTKNVLAKTDDIVVPVSTEMDCGTCHGTADTDLNILKAHDKLSGTKLADDLKNGKRYKCADCHQDNILGASGKPDVLPLSQAMHGFHAGKVSMLGTDPVCYSCHPGPVTQCYRGVMKTEGIGCVNSKCHGDMNQVAASQAQGREAWLQEPDCAACHGEKYGSNTNTLYQNSYLQNAPDAGMSNLILCASCHNSTHAEWPSSLAADNLLPQSLLGKAGFIDRCTVCHSGSGKIHIGP